MYFLMLCTVKDYNCDNSITNAAPRVLCSEVKDCSKVMMCYHNWEIIDDTF